MTCAVIRKRLIAEPVRPREVGAHLAACAECSSFAERLDLARSVLADHGVVVEPDAGFAARVASRIGRPSDVLGWAAMRMLPAAMALVIALGAVANLSPPGDVSSASAEPSDVSDADDVLLWIADGAEDEP